MNADTQYGFHYCVASLLIATTLAAASLAGFGPREGTIVWLLAISIGQLYAVASAGWPSQLRVLGVGSALVAAAAVAALVLPAMNYEPVYIPVQVSSISQPLMPLV